MNETAMRPTTGDLSDTLIAEPGVYLTLDDGATLAQAVDLAVVRAQRRRIRQHVSPGYTGGFYVLDVHDPARRG